jgi:hypothetical protein
MCFGEKKKEKLISKLISLSHFLALHKPASIVHKNTPCVVARILAIPHAVSSSHAVS